jgi:polygalacturonase
MKSNINDSHTIQQLIDVASESGKNEVVIKANPNNENGVWYIAKAIELPSNMTVYIDNCTLRLADGVFCHIFCNSLAYLENPDVQDEQSNIHIIGIGNAILDGGNHNGLMERTSEKDGFPHISYNTTVLFRNVRNFSVKGIHIMNPRWWAMTFIYAQDGIISDVSFYAINNVPNQDGIDLRVGCNNILIENISGLTGDDSIALTALSGRFEKKMCVCGKDTDIHDITIKNIQTEVTGGHHIIRLLNHDGNKLYNIHISDVFDKTVETGGKRAKAALKIGDSNYSRVCKAKVGETHSITVRNIVTRAEYAALIGNANVTNSEFSQIKNDEGILFNILC